MAKKKPSLTGLFDRTETKAQEPELTKEQKEKRRRPVGVYLRVATRAEVEKIAKDEALPVHGLLAYAVAYFVKQYKAGKVKIEREQHTKLKLD